MITVLVCTALFLFVIGAIVDSLADGADGICVLILLTMVLFIAMASIFRLIEVLLRWVR